MGQISKRFHNFQDPVNRHLSALILILQLCCVLLPQARGQDGTHEELWKKVRNLEAANRHLVERVRELEETVAQNAGDDDHIMELIEELYEQQEEAASGIVSHYRQNIVTFQFYGSLGFSVGDPAPDDAGQSLFSFNSMDFFLTAQLGEHFQIVSETILEGQDAEIVLDQERLFGVYRFAEGSAWLKFGIEHSVVSYWNRIYHHGSWLYQGVSRPTIGSFEDDGGVLPAHNAGLELGARFQTGLGDLEVIAAVSNGRGPHQGNRQLTGDDNDAKAVEVALRLTPFEDEDLLFGGAFRYDIVPRDLDHPNRSHSIREWIATGFVHWERGDFQLLGEVAFIDHEDQALDHHFRHATAYLQVSLSFGDLTPYLRFDFRSMARGDPFYLVESLDLDRWEQVVGLRWDFVEGAAIKVEGAFGEQEVRFSNATIEPRSFLAFRLSLVWVF